MKFADDASNDEILFDINVIPLIDVLLVLLIFFMASASFVAAGGIDVHLPKSSMHSQLTETKSVSVTVDRAGAVQVDGRNVSLDELKGYFRSVAAQTPRPLVVVRADEKAEHGSVVRVLDEAKVEGLEEVAIATAPRPE